jgi:hypothetical protein
MGRVAVTEAAIGKVTGSLRTLDGDLEMALKSSAQELREAAGTIDAELVARKRESERAEAGLSLARQALDRCAAADPPVDCSGPARAVSNAERALSVAHRRQQAAQDAQGKIRAAESDLSQASARARSRIRESIPAAISECSRAMARVAGYLQGSGGAVGSGGGAAAVGPRSAGSAAGSFAPAGVLGPVEQVPLSSIDSSDSNVTGPASFEKISWADAQWSTDALSSVVAPGVSQGKGRDYFAQRDRQEGRSGVRSYASVYDGYFGSDRAIKLSQGSDGRLHVSNGYHRIWAAERAGLPSVPARVRR